jgi:glycosyltransferase involved in cell wall biosynthesis
MHVLVVTCAHRGDDARIVHRQARVLLEAGHRVTLVAPDPGSDARASDPAGLVRMAVPRAVGRRRWPAWKAVRLAVAQAGAAADLILIHDPELVPVVGFGRRRWRRPVLVWDVHEDFLASVSARSWIPRPLRPVAGGAVRGLQWLARRRFRLLLAEDAYTQTLGDAPVVPNSTWVPDVVAEPSEPWRAVYVGRLSRGRGLDTMIAAGRRLREQQSDVTVVLVGAADADVHDLLTSAHAQGDVTWLGPLPNPAAMAHLSGALAGLSLLHDEANYHHSRPTQCVEYLAHGVPVITTPLPLARQLVEVSGGGVVTSGFDGPEVVSEVVTTVTAWLDDLPQRSRLGHRGHAHVVQHHSWQHDGARFVGLLEGHASSDPRCDST